MIFKMYINCSQFDMCDFQLASMMDWSMGAVIFRVWRSMVYSHWLTIFGSHVRGEGTC